MRRLQATRTFGLVRTGEVFEVSDEEAERLLREGLAKDHSDPHPTEHKEEKTDE